MLQQTDLSAAIDAYEQSTSEAIRAARQVTLPPPPKLTFRTSELEDADVDALLQKVPSLQRGEKKTRGFLYLFQTAERCNVGRLIILGAMQEAKNRQEKGEKNLCAVNQDSLDGRTLYVGRSWTPASRISGHLKADLTSGTFAIHFAAWARELDLDVELLIYGFPGIADRTLQVLEDGLWDRLRPLFGRRGAK